MNKTHRGTFKNQRKKKQELEHYQDKKTFVNE
jgi:hypothetical protein